MINKFEILTIAREIGLRPDIVEKDYVLSWILAGISSHPELQPDWVFKGGTCIKKCYLGAYRFSEDLDFTLRRQEQIDNDFLMRVFREVGEWIYDRSGIDLPFKRYSFEIFENPRGKQICQGRISYRGPISPHPLPRIKLDLSADEEIVTLPIEKQLIHPYSDADTLDVRVPTYSFEELLAEKIRALWERTRPRDLYDVVNLFKHAGDRIDIQAIRSIAEKKCTFKGMERPREDVILARRAQLQANWESMLGHQLAELPSLDEYLENLKNAFSRIYP